MLFTKKNNKIVLFSGGPDSIFLCNYLLKKTEAKKIVLLFVNYHPQKLKTKEQKIVEKYAKFNNLKLIIKKFKISIKTNSNFQATARKFRYKKAVELADKYNTKFILTGHQMNDFIETTTMQKNRKGKTNYYGISHTSHYKNNYYLIRPILRFSKKQIIDNLKSIKQQYYEDPSNLSNKYNRNKIRKNIKKINTTAKITFFLKNLINHYLFHKYNNNLKIMKKIIKNDTLNLSFFLKLSKVKQSWIIRNWLFLYINKLSRTKVKSIFEFIMTNYKTTIAKKFTIQNNKYLVLKKQQAFIITKIQTSKKTKQNQKQDINYNFNK